MWIFWQFALALAFFHTSEFSLALVYSPKEVSWKCTSSFGELFA
jgi:hypothetical protein